MFGGEANPEDIHRYGALVAIDVRTAAELRGVRRDYLVPVVLFGVNLDHQTSPFIAPMTFWHAEVGLGVEDRMRAGLVLGADVRVGVAIPHEDIPVDDVCARSFDETSSCQQQGEYRAARLYAAIRF